MTVLFVLIVASLKQLVSENLDQKIVLFYLSGNSQSLKQGVSEAKDIIENAQAFEKLLALAEISRSGEA